MGVYDHVPRSEVKNDKLVRVRWVRTKGMTLKPKVKCRLVALEFARNEVRDDLFSGTPPLFAIRLMLSLAASSGSVEKAIMIMDVRCAFLYGECKRTFYIHRTTSRRPEEPRRYLRGIAEKGHVRHKRRSTSVAGNSGTHHA